MANKKYRLWAAATDEDSIKAAETERFSRVGVAYVLIYARKKPESGKWAEITDENVNVLNAAEAQWLWDCNVTLIAEETAKNREAIMESVNEKLEKLEAALKRQREIETAQKSGCGETCSLEPYFEAASERP